MTNIEEQAREYVMTAARPRVQEDPYFVTGQMKQPPQSREWRKAFQKAYDERFGDIYVRTLRKTGRMQ